MSNAKNPAGISKCGWLADNQYGTVLKELCYAKVKASQAALFAVQGAFHALGFPIGDKNTPVIAKVSRRVVWTVAMIR